MGKYYINEEIFSIRTLSKGESITRVIIIATIPNEPDLSAPDHNLLPMLPHNASRGS